MHLICTDTGFADKGIGKLISAKQVVSLKASHIGLNPETGRQMTNGDIDVELIPQGTLAERIRCGGAGIGGFLTQTGIGTMVEENKQKNQQSMSRNICWNCPLKPRLPLFVPL